MLYVAARAGGTCRAHVERTTLASGNRERLQRLTKIWYLSGKGQNRSCSDFVESWQIRYDVPSNGELKEHTIEAQRNEHKAKVFCMCAFTGEMNQKLTITKLWQK